MNAGPEQPIIRREILLLATAFGALTLLVVIFFPWHRSRLLEGSKKAVKSLPSTEDASSPQQASRTAKRGANSRSDDGVAHWGKAEWEKRLAEASLKNYPALLKQAMLIKDAALRAEIVGKFSAQWINQDLRDFLAFVNAEDVDDAGDATTWKILLPAFEYALSLLNERAASMLELQEVLRRLVAAKAAEDPAEAVTWSRRWLEGDALASALATASVEMARKSPAQATEILTTITQPVRRVDAITGIASVLAQMDANQALQWVNGLADPAEQPYAMGSLLSTLAKQQPALAAKEFTAFSNKLNADYALQMQTTRVIEGRDPSKETESGAAKRDSADEPEIPTANPQLHMLAQSGIIIAEQWAAVDPAGAMQWVDALPTGRMKRDALQGALGSWAKVNPQGALAAYEQNYASNPQIAENIFHAWAERNPVNAATQAADVGDEEQRSYAIAGAVGGWLENTTDSTAAGSWAGQLPGVKSRDVAYSAIADAIVDTTPADAWKYASRIQDATMRKEAMNSAFANLAAFDPALAKSTLASTNLSVEEATTLRALLDAVLPSTVD